jgi:hypothetical protein
MPWPSASGPGVGELFDVANETLIPRRVGYRSTAPPSHRYSQRQRYRHLHRHQNRYQRQYQHRYRHRHRQRYRHKYHCEPLTCLSLHCSNQVSFPTTSSRTPLFHTPSRTTTRQPHFHLEIKTKRIHKWFASRLSLHSRSW